MPNLGLITYELEMEITQLKDDFFICQKNYTNEIIKKLKLENCNQISTPMKQIQNKVNQGADKVNETYFRSSLDV